MSNIAPLIDKQLNTVTKGPLLRFVSEWFTALHNRAPRERRVSARAILCLAMLLLTSHGLPPSAWGQTFMNTARVQLTGSVFEKTLSGLSQSDFYDNSLPPTSSVGTVVADGSESANVELAHASSFAFASSDYGQLKLSITGALQTSSQYPGTHIRSSGMLRTTGFATWFDTATVSGLEYGKKIVLNGELALDGSMEASATNTAARPSLAKGTVTLNLSGTGAGAAGGVYEITGFSPVHINNPPPELIPVHVEMFVGFPHAITYTLEADGRCESESAPNVIGNNYVGGNIADSSFGAFYSSTLNWRGITSITDAATGQPLSGWAVTSASGFDYSKPYPVPEPLSAVMLVIGILAMRFRRRAGTL